MDFLTVLEAYLGFDPTEREYREHFGATPDVTSATWAWSVITELLPAKAQPFHLLWLFYWWKSNALQGRCCKFLGGIEKIRIDKNTFNKWRDLMEEAVSNLPVVRIT
jgi:hypothetical protein